MKTVKRMSFAMHLLVIAAFLTVPIQSIAADDVIARAMADELARTSKQLVMPGMEPPYFVSYCIEDEFSAEIIATNGAIVESNQKANRQFFVDVRVGDHKLDNSYFIGHWRDLFGRPMTMVEEDDYAGIRHQLWLYTDVAYKKALENLAGKKAYLASHPVTVEIPDFVAAESRVVEDEPVDLALDLSFRQEQVDQASKALGAFAGLQEWQVILQAEASNKRYLNSEGARFLKTRNRCMLEISATALAADGQRLTNFRRLLTVDPDEILSGDEIVKEAQTVARELLEMAEAPALDEYAGPVLFSECAAAQVITQLFSGQLTPARSPLMQEGWMRQYMPDAKLVRRVNRRVMPEFMHVTDDPTRELFDGVKLAGHRLVDDEAVASQKIELIRAGRLVNLPMSRRPSKKIRSSNGHASLLDNQWIVPTVSSLFVESDKTKTEAELLTDLRKTAGEFGNEYGLLVKRLDRPEISSRYSWSTEQEASTELMTDPLIMYKVYVDDGRVEPVRGLTPDDITVRSLRDIIAIGDTVKAFNMLVSTSIQPDAYAVTVVTGSILIEDAGFKAVTSREPLPVSTRPLVAAK
ncbi:MAG: hypothetical protein K8R59_12415 [Thermoanaerobaculales bacterium]|nr:hypothetical protein [Thermoanaerobaculales bacterium]